MVNTDDTVAVLHALRELAEGQSYFREHLSHANARIAELERLVAVASERRETPQQVGKALADALNGRQS